MRQLPSSGNVVQTPLQQIEFLKEVIIMSGERLLERLRTWEREPHRRGSDDQRRCVDSIIDHLQKMLNTRQGNVPIADDYGVPDFLDFLQSYPDSVREIEMSIKSAIEAYEPRLSGTNVTFIPDEDETLTLRFQIMARLATEGERQVFFETMVDTDGKISVRR
jgi:type VI secretion system protein